jgi:hypothetical protein
MLRVRVEADKQKLSATLESVIDFVMQQNDPTGLNTEMKAEMEKMKSEMHDDIASMGSLKGILMADKETFEPRGFAGQATDSSGAITMNIDILVRRNGDAHVKIDNPKNPSDSIAFEKKGDAFTLVAEGKKVAEGTMTAKKFTMTGYQGSTTLFSADFDINKADDSSLDLKGKILVPAGGSEISVDSFKLLFSNSFKNLTFDSVVRVSLLGSPAFALTISTERKEVPSISVEEPSVAKPFKTLQQDFAPILGAVMQ